MRKPSLIRPEAGLLLRLVPLLASTALLASACVDPADAERSQDDAAQEAAGTAPSALTTAGAQHFEGYGGPDGDPHYGLGLAVGRFNGDAFDDLVLSTDQESIEIRMGSSSGVSTTPITISQDSSGMPDSKEDGDWFGYALAAGDFNGDGVDDIAIGAPKETISGHASAGVVNVHYNSTGGSVPSPQLFSRDSAGIPGAMQSNELFGFALATGRFDDDEFDDLAIGCPYRSSQKGAVVVLYGSSSGLSGVGSQEWTQDSSGIAGIAEAGDLFGYSLAAGDFDGDTIDDLAIGVPDEDLMDSYLVPEDDAGAVNVIYGTSTGLSSSGNQVWSGEDDGLNYTPGYEAHFGVSLAAGAFNTDGKDDLVIGVISHDVGSIEGAGAVVVMYGSSTGLGLSMDQTIHQGSNKVAGTPEDRDFCGRSVAVGDVNGDGWGDVLFGCADEGVVTGEDNHGAFNVIYGPFFTSAYSPEGEFWYQDMIGVPGHSLEYGWFSYTLAAGDFNGDGKDDVAASDAYMAGSLTILRGD